MPNALERQHPLVKIVQIILNKFIITLIGLGIVFVGTGCQTMGPVKYHELQTGSWKSKILVRDKRKHKSVIVNVDINAVAFSKLRLDATSTLGRHLASMVFVDESLSYILVSERKYFKGKAKSKAMRRILGSDVDPRLLHNMIFDQAPSEKVWTCVRDKKGYLQECSNTKNNDKIVWKNRDAGRKLVILDNSKATLQISFAGFSPELAKKKNLFSLKIPKSFKRIR